MGDVDSMVRIFTATDLGKCRISPMLGRLYPQVLIIVGLVDPRSSRVLRTEENVHPSDTRNRTRAVEHVAKHIAS